MYPRDFPNPGQSPLGYTFLEGNMDLKIMKSTDWKFF